MAGNPSRQPAPPKLCRHGWDPQDCVSCNDPAACPKCGGVAMDENLNPCPSCKGKGKAPSDGNRWRVVVELTWDVLPEDTADGAEADHAVRAFRRVREALGGLMGYAGSERVSDGVLAHFHVLEAAARCHE